MVSMLRSVSILLLVTMSRYAVRISAILLTALGAIVNGQEYSAEGLIVVVRKLEPTDTGKSNVYAFYVEVLGPKYKVRVREHGEGDDYYEYAFADGLMRILHHLKRTPRSLSTGGLQTNVPFMYPARVEQREFPPNDGTRAQFVWFALASHCFFRDLTNEFILPIWSPEDPETRRQPFPMRVIVQLFPSTPHLPTGVSFINDGFYRSYNPVTKSLDVVSLAPPFDKGYTNAVYQVLTVTNTARNTLPASFAFAVYSSPIRGGELPFERLIIRGTTTKVADSAPEGAMMRPFKGLASVVDYRLYGVVRLLGQQTEYRYGAYPITNGAWLNSTQSAAMRRKIEKGLERKLQLASADHKARQKFGVSWIVGTFFIPLIWIFWRAVRQKLNRRKSK